jgi:DNA-binding response OmpR family regulator
MPTDAGTDRQRILIVEDDARLATLLGEYLSTHGFTVDVESRGDRASAHLGGRPALVVLDLMLPGLSD